MTEAARIAVIPGDGIGVEVTEATLHLCDLALARVGLPALSRDVIAAGAAYFRETGQDIQPDGETRAGQGEAIFLGAIGLPSVRHKDGTEISPHLRLRDLFGLYAGVRPVKAYPNAPQRLADPRAASLDLVILRESTEGLFYSAAVHGRAEVFGDDAVHDIMRITRPTTEKLHWFGFRLAEKRKARGGKGQLTCVDKSNVFTSQAFFRKIYDEIAPEFPKVTKGYAYIDAMALDLVRKPWEADVLVMENIFGDILSDLAGGLVGGMGMAACGEYGDDHALFQPAHGSAPDITGQDAANPLAAVLSGAMMLDYIADRRAEEAFADAAALIEAAVQAGFEANDLRPMEFGGDMGCRAMVSALETHLAEVSP
ncbi:isocitrate/isopropylmalate dehydrogenase family protein [Pseudaestuariivita sp.]|uniref:isocitrate/isopropylmalate dehydrogenase family protein n=1 Tax=Pseudaestuariivita sp. TaxID=2211669 RepID=UPI0040585988